METSNEIDIILRDINDMYSTLADEQESKEYIL